MNAERLAGALGGKKSGDGWSCLCPAHEDRKPSLSISVGDDGKTLVCCHAGCSQEAIIEALKQRGLWGNTGQRGPRPKPNMQEADTSEYALEL